MATVQADRAATGVAARAQEKGVFCEVSTYEFDSTAAGTVVEMCKVAAGTTLIDGYLINDALGGSTTCDVGDGDNDDAWIAAVDTSSAALTRFGEAPATSWPKTYTADDTIDVTVEGATATGTITLVVYFTRETVDLT